MKTIETLRAAIRNHEVSRKLRAGMKRIRSAPGRHEWIDEVAQQSDKRFRALVEHSSDAVTLLDVEGQIVYEGPTLHRLTGYSEAEVLGKSPLDFMHPEDAPLMREALARVTAQPGTTERQVFRSFRKDGSVQWVEAIGTNLLNEPSVRAIVVNYRDITEHKVAESALRASEEDLRVTLQSIGDAVIATDLQGRITRINAVAERLTGSTAAQASGLHLDKVLRIVQSGSRTPSRNPVTDVVTSSKTTDLAPDSALIAANGQERRIAGSCAPIRSEAGETRGVVLAFRDITEEHRIQEELGHLQKLDAIGRLVAGVAHDFNNMLGGITGAAELVARRLPEGDDTSAQLLSQLLDAAGRAADLIGSLLAFARKRRVHSSPVDIHGVIASALGLLEKTIDKRIEIQTELATGASMVLGDATLLQNVVLNLGVNASHAMPNGGTLRLRSRHVELTASECEASAFELRPGRFIEIELSDTGCGIAPEELPHIFEPFFTTKEPGKGTGLGLSTVYGTLRQHHGAVTVSSELGKGTCVRLLLPMTDAAAESPRAEVTPAGGKGSILLVDDEALMRSTTKALLEGLGYDVLVAENGRDALELFRRRMTELDLVILDMNMPEMNGRDCFAAMQQIRPGIHVIMTSGCVRSEELLQLETKGLSGFLQKPFRRVELSRVVANALRSDARASGEHVGVAIPT